jgi:gamma-glutamylcyclotransferase (GGCT)/AIG2-like uncharacterized protein YtfP
MNVPKRPAKPRKALREAYLFVYGTLRTAALHKMSATLNRQGELLGVATMPGRLYDLGEYPGAIPKSGRSVVWGEVYRLRNPTGTLRTLDRYEGLNGEKQREFRRVRKRVRLVSGKPVTAWVYVLDQPTRGLTVISSGDYLSGFSKRLRQERRVS